MNWLEYLDRSSRGGAVDEVRRLYNSKFTVGRNARIVVLNAGQTCAAVYAGTQDERVLDILHIPLKGDPSHSGIYNMRPDQELIAELIRETVRETHQARF